MKTKNKVILIGFLAAEPVKSVLDNDKICINIVLKTVDYYKLGTEKKSDKNFHNCVLWNGIGERAMEILHKGDVVSIEGKLKNHKIEDSGVVFYKTEIKVEEWTKICSETQVLGSVFDKEESAD